MENPNLERGEQLFEMGRYKDAITYLKNALHQETDSFAAKYLLAQSYFQINDLEKAMNLALDLRRMEPDYDGVYLLLSQLYLHTDKENEAILNIDKALSLNPYDENHFGQKAYILLSQKKFDDALTYADEGLKLNAKSAFCLNARATALTKLKKHHEADQTIENLLQDNPESAYSHASVGWSFLEQNNHKQARKHFKESLALDPNLEHARSGMLTSIKANNPIYRLFLKYAFWIGNKSEKNQWVFLIGIYLVYRFSVKLLSTTGMTYLAIPLVIAYLLFALGAWIMEPLSNMILLFDKNGRFLLDKNDKLSGQIMLLLILFSLTSFAFTFVIDSDYALLFALAFLAMIIPATRAASAQKEMNRTINSIYSLVILAVPVVATMINYNYSTSLIIVVGLFIAYTWLGNLISR